MHPHDFLTNTGRRLQHIDPGFSRSSLAPCALSIGFEVLLCVFKSLNGLTPPYVSELLSLYTPGRSLRSANHDLLKIPRIRCKTRGEFLSANSAPKLWNDLPLDVKLSSTLQVFKSRLKTHFFSAAFSAVSFTYVLFICYFMCLFFFIDCPNLFLLVLFYCTALWSAPMPMF